jgi:hypothetical protein
MWLLGALAVLSGMFGVIFLGLVMTHRGDADIHMILVSFAMFLPALALVLALLTVFVPLSKTWKILASIFGLMISIPATILYVGSSGREAILYLIPIVVLFLWAWSRLAFVKPIEPQ